MIIALFFKNLHYLGNEFKDKLKRILISYSRLDLKAIFWEYRRLTNNVGLTVKIDQIYKGDAKTAYKTIGIWNLLSIGLIMPCARPSNLQIFMYFSRGYRR